MKINPKIIPLIPPIITGLIALTIIYLVYRWILSKNNADQTYQDEINPNDLSYPESQYYIFADQIQTATSSWNDDEQAIYDVMNQMHNNADLLQLILAFGSRSYWAGTGLVYNASLSEVLHAKLDNSELAYVNEILAGNGVTLTI